MGAVLEGVFEDNAVVLKVLVIALFDVDNGEERRLGLRREKQSLAGPLH